MQCYLNGMCSFPHISNYKPLKGPYHGKQKCSCSLEIKDFDVLRNIYNSKLPPQLIQNIYLNYKQQVIQKSQLLCRHNNCRHDCPEPTFTKTMCNELCSKQSRIGMRRALHVRVLRGKRQCQAAANEARFLDSSCCSLISVKMSNYSPP